MIRTRVGALALVLGFGLSHAQAQSKHVRTSMTGLWETELSVALANGEVDKAAAKIPAVPGGPPPEELELFKRVQLWQPPPYNSEWQRRSGKAAKRLAGTDVARVKGCTPPGFPAVMDSFAPDGMFQVVITAAETLLLSPDGEVRQIYTDGRKHPATEDLWPTPLGDSIGYWDGDALVIDTIARKAGPISPLPIPGIAELSEQAHFTERLRLVDSTTLQDEMTIDDPERFSHPWQMTIRYKRVTDVNRMITTNCTENDRDQIVNGTQTIVAP